MVANLGVPGLYLVPKNLYQRSNEQVHMLSRTSTHAQHIT